MFFLAEAFWSLSFLPTLSLRLQKVLNVEETGAFTSHEAAQVKHSQTADDSGHFSLIWVLSGDRISLRAGSV